MIKIEKKSFVFLCGFVSNEPTRYNLRNIHFDKNGSVYATDGHRLGRIDGFETDSDLPENGVNIPIEKNLLSTLKKDKSEFVYIEKDGETGTIRTDSGLSFKVFFDDCNYPDCERVIPKERNGSPKEIAFNFKYINSFSGYDKSERLKIEFASDDNTSPVIIKNTALENFTGVLMPIRI